MKIISGKIIKPQKVVIYGPEGIGKSTFAAQFPKPCSSTRKAARRTSK